MRPGGAMKGRGQCAEKEDFTEDPAAVQEPYPSLLGFVVICWRPKRHEHLPAWPDWVHRAIVCARAILCARCMVSIYRVLRTSVLWTGPGGTDQWRPGSWQLQLTVSLQAPGRACPGTSFQIWKGETCRHQARRESGRMFVCWLRVPCNTPSMEHFFWRIWVRGSDVTCYMHSQTGLASREGPWHLQGRGRCLTERVSLCNPGWPWTCCPSLPRVMMTGFSWLFG